MIRDGRSNRDGILFATFVSIAQQISYPLASELGAEGSRARDPFGDNQSYSCKVETKLRN